MWEPTLQVYHRYLSECVMFAPQSGIIQLILALPKNCRRRILARRRQWHFVFLLISGAAGIRGFSVDTCLQIPQPGPFARIFYSYRLIGFDKAVTINLTEFNTSS